MNNILLIPRTIIRNNPLLLSIAKKITPKSLLVKITKPNFIPTDKELIHQQQLLIVCNDGFDQNFLNATSLIRIGYARGWSKVCGPAKLVSIYSLLEEIKLYHKPAIFMSVYDFNQLTILQAKKLRNFDVFVWASIHPKKIKEFKSKIILKTNDDKNWIDAYPKIIAAEPKFLWNSCTKSCLYWYDDWIKDGLKWESIHPAADIEKYYPESNNKFNKIKIAYVGGYWKEKAQALDTYLNPFEDIFVPFGYESWPYRNYGGKISQEEERKLYSSAQIIPLITGPAGWLMGEITERYLRAPACKAFCIADQNPALRDIFTKDEMIQAKNANHFNELVNDVLKGKIDRVSWAEKSYQAVIKKHLYTHRAIQIKKALTK